MIVRAEKQELPKHVASQMDLWRMGFSAMPADYIRFHARVARVELQRLQSEYGVVVHGKPVLVRDGWMDGMRVVEAVIENQKGILMKLRWHDGNQGFFVKAQGHGGASALFEKDLTGDISNDFTFLPKVTF